MASKSRLLSLEKILPISKCKPTLLLFCVLLCPADTGAPSNAIRFSQVIEQLSQNDAFREKLLQSLDNLPNAWGLIGDKQRARLRDFILQRNWSGIDHFPAITVGELRASVTAANAAARHYPSVTAKLAPPYVEVGPFSTSSGGEAGWQPSEAELQSPAADPLKDLGYGLMQGDPPHPELWKWHNRSVRAAFLFNRLSLNPLLDHAHAFHVRIGSELADSPQSLLALLIRSGADVWIEDSRYFANFGHLHFKGQDVMMPFWLNTAIPLPHSKEKLLVPVSHAENEIRIRGSQGNADVSFYFGIDGMTEFRTMDTLDQYWVGKNVAHEYRDAQAIEVTRLLGEALKTYAVLQREHPALPFNGYYRFGVCQDVIAGIEMKMQGQTTLFPITHDPEYFSGKSEIDRLFARLPNDRRGKPDWSRVRGSLPAQNFADLQIPGLARNLELVAESESQGREVKNWSWSGAAILLALSAFLIARSRRPAKSQQDLPK